MDLASRIVSWFPSECAAASRSSTVPGDCCSLYAAPTSHWQVSSQLRGHLREAVSPMALKLRSRSWTSWVNRSSHRCQLQSQSVGATVPSSSCNLWLLSNRLTWAPDEPGPLISFRMAQLPWKPWKVELSVLPQFTAGQPFNRRPDSCLAAVLATAGNLYGFHWLLASPHYPRPLSASTCHWPRLDIFFMSDMHLGLGGATRPWTAA